MCLIVVEVLFLMAGVYMLWRGKVPQDFFSVLFGGKYIYEMEPSQARKLGAWLAWPLPTLFLAGLGVALLFGTDAATMVSLVEPIIVILVALVALWVVRKHRRPKPQEPVAPPTP